MNISNSLFQQPCCNSINTTLLKFDISYHNGFLPASPPLKELPDYYAPWDYLVYNLPTLNNKKRLRSFVDTMPLLEVDSSKLHSLALVQRAYSILCLIAHSYIWSEELNTLKFQDSIPILPKQIAVPWWHVSKMLEINCVLTHASVDLYNWELIVNNKEISVDNMRCLHTMTGTRDEEWFFLIMTDIEKKGANILRKLMSIQENMQNDNDAGIMINLKDIKKGITQIARVTGRMKENCNPDTFYNVLRPYLGGWKSNNALPNGLIYEGVSDTPIKLYGGSAAESTLISVIDVAFQVEHKSPYFTEIRNYMPGKHREFIEYVKENIRIKDYIENKPVLKLMYDECIREIGKFRQVHYGLVSNYILKMIKPVEVVEDDKKEAVGTGGTILKEFLNDAIDETFKNIKKV